MAHSLSGRYLPFYLLFPVGTYAYHSDPAFAELLKTFDVALAYFGKLLKASAFGNVVPKALVFLVYGLTALKFFKRGGEILYNRAVGLLIGNAYFQRIQSREGVKLVHNKAVI